MRWGKPPPFFQEPCFRVQNPACDTTKRKPSIKITADYETVTAVTLAKSGYFGGNPQIVLNTPVDIVLQTYQYEMFTRKFEETCHEMNKEVK